MAFYFCMADILGQIEKSDQPDQELVPVSTEVPGCGGYSRDAFIVGSDLNMLDFTAATAAYSLAELLENVPLYRINIELALDKALGERHDNVAIDKALKAAFQTKRIPQALQDEQDKSEIPEYTSTGLMHPMVGYMETFDLCKIYIDFLNNFENIPEPYRFEKAVLGRQSKRFKEYYEGFCTRYSGQIMAGPLIRHSRRKDHDLDKKQHSYVEDAAPKVAAMHITEPQEMIWAWLEAEHYQMRRCTEIERVLTHYKPRVYPVWLRTEMLCFLEKEMLKQNLAALLKNSAPQLTLLQDTPDLRRAIEASSQKQIDKDLDALITEILNRHTGYSGAAGKFAISATRRQEEAQKAGLLL